MTTSVQNFSPHLLNDYSKLEQFMRGDKALADIERLSKDPVFIQSPSNTPYFNRWHVVWIIIKTPFEIFFLASFLSLAILCQCLFLHKIVRICVVLSKHLARDISHFSNRLYKQLLLMPARNSYQISSWDIYLQDSIPIDSIKDEKIKKMTFYWNDEKINFFKSGVCRGGAIWFIYLFLKTAHLFKDKQKQLIAIAEQFKTGIPKEGALLQSFRDLHKILKLKEKFTLQNQIYFKELESAPKKALEKFKLLPAGIYMARTSRHALIYFKENNSQGYMWDSNSGLYPKTAKEFFYHIILNYQDSENPKSKICFHQFVNKKSSNIIIKLFKKIPFIKNHKLNQKVKFYLE